MLYQHTYAWYIFVSTLDTILTAVILTMGGREVNAVAAAVLEHWGLRGMIAFKFLLVVLVVVICEWIGRQRPSTGRRIATMAVALTAVPVALALYLLSTVRF